MKPGTDCRDTGATTGAKIRSAAQSEERRRLARLSDQWADRAVTYGLEGKPDAVRYAAAMADGFSVAACIARASSLPGGRAR